MVSKGFPNVITSGRQYNIGEKPSVILQRIVLATEETTVTQQKSAIDLSNTNPACGHKEVRRSTGHIMGKARYSDQQESKSRQKVMRLYINGTDQHQNSSSHLREQPRSTQIVVAYPRPAFLATNRTNCVPTSFGQQVQVSQGHILYKNKEIKIPRYVCVWSSHIAEYGSTG